MAFDKVVSISLENQWYRRCAQISILEVLHFPMLDGLYHVVWAKNFEECGQEPIVASLVDMGFKHWEQILSNPNSVSTHIRYHDLSLFEAQMRALQYCLETEQNILLIADDVYFTQTYSEIKKALHNLVEVTKKTQAPVGVCQLTYGADPNGKYSKARAHVKTPLESREFLQGVMGQSTSALFVTPFGARKVLNFLKKEGAPIEVLEVMPPLYWYSKKWMYTTTQRGLVRFISAMNGHSLAAKVEEHEELKIARAGRTDGRNRRQKSYNVLKQYRIPFEQ